LCRPAWNSIRRWQMNLPVLRRRLRRWMGIYSCNRVSIRLNNAFSFIAGWSSPVARQAHNLKVGHPASILAQEQIMPLAGQKRKTGPLCSSHLRKGPALSYLAAMPNGCKGRFISFGEISLWVRVATRRRKLPAVDATTSFSLKSSLPLSWWLPSRSSLPSSLSWPCRPLQRTGSVNMHMPCIGMHNIETISQRQN